MQLTISTEVNGVVISSTVQADIEGYLSKLSAEEIRDWAEELIVIRAMDAGRRALRNNDSVQAAVNDFLAGVKRSRKTKTVTKYIVLNRKMFREMGLTEPQVDDILDFASESVLPQENIMEEIQKMIVEFKKK